MPSKIFSHYLLIAFWVVYFVLYILYSELIINVLWETHFWTVIFSYVSALIAIFTSFSIFSLILRSTRKFVEHLWEKKDSKIYPILSGWVLKFMMYANYIVSIYIGFTLLIIPKEYNHIVNKFVSTIFIIIALIVVSNLIIIIFEKRWVFQFKFANNLSLHLSSIIKKILLVFLWIIWGITIISNLWYDVSALIAWAWIGWLALALWAQKSLTNVFWAITIVLNKPFRIGDFVKIDQTTGTVKDIWISYLTIIDQWGHQVMIPNEVIMTSFVENFSVRENRRTDLVIGLEYNTSDKKIKKAVTVVEKLLKNYIDARKIESFRVNFDKFWEYSLDINITYFSLIKDYKMYLKQKENINLEMKNLFKKEKLEIAFPTRSLIIQNETKND